MFYNLLILFFIIIILGKYINYHIYMNYNESNNKYMRELNKNCKSCVGPIKAKFARNKIFEPY